MTDSKNFQPSGPSAQYVPEVDCNHSDKDMGYISSSHSSINSHCDHAYEQECPDIQESQDFNWCNEDSHYEDPDDMDDLVHQFGKFFSTKINSKMVDMSVFLQGVIQEQQLHLQRMLNVVHQTSQVSFPCCESDEKSLHRSPARKHIKLSGEAINVQQNTQMEDSGSEMCRLDANVNCCNVPVDTVAPLPRINAIPESPDQFIETGRITSQFPEIPQGETPRVDFSPDLIFTDLLKAVCRISTLLNQKEFRT